jgi:hypothetical protein
MNTPSLICVRRGAAGFLEGQARAGSGPRGELLARFLQSDVQGDGDAVAALLAAITAAERGAMPQPALIGNAFAIRIGPYGAVIENVVMADPRPQHYTLAELRAALAAWLAAIRDEGCNRA